MNPIPPRKLHKKNASSGIITSGIYFGQIHNVTLSNHVNITHKKQYNLRTTPSIRRPPIPPTSPKQLIPKKEELLKQVISLASPKFYLKSVAKLKSFEFLQTNDELNQSVEQLQEVADQQLGIRRRHTRRPQTAISAKSTMINFKDQYVLYEQIGQGSYAHVRRAVDMLSGREVAVKIYDRATCKRNSVRKEIQILQHLNHCNIIKLHDVVYSEQQIQLIMEFAGTCQLRNHLKLQPNRQLPEQEAKHIFSQLVKAVDYCHSLNIIHRDIKLENILIKDNKVSLIDFGFSTFIEPKMTAYCGTPSYMSPEVVSRLESGKPSDVWSMGVVLYVLLHGHFPFQGRNQKELFAQIKSGVFVFSSPSSAQHLINNMLRVRTYERYSTREILRDAWFQQ